MTLHVLTLNLLHEGAVNPAGDWKDRFPLVIEVLRSGADIIALQEATHPQLTDLERTLPELAVLRGPESGETRLPPLVQRLQRWVRRVPHHPDSRRGEHCAILYRRDRFHALEGNAFWVSHQPHLPGSVLPWTWLPRVVNWVRLEDRESGKVVTVYNAHLDFLPWAPLRSARILRRIMDTHWDGTTQVLMGDFNAPPRSKAYQHLGSELNRTTHPPLQDAWQVAAERVGPEGTFHGGTGRIRWTGRLDRVLFRSELVAARVETLTHCQGKVYPSDHYPVRVTLEEKSR